MAAAFGLVACVGRQPALEPANAAIEPRTPVVRGAAPSLAPLPAVSAAPLASVMPPADPAALEPGPEGSVTAEATAPEATAPEATAPEATAPENAPPAPVAPPAHCAGVPPLGPDGAAPRAPRHLPLGQDVEVPGDRPLYLLAGESGDARVIVYMHGMCGDVAAADYFREAVRAHGTLLALRGDTHCAGDRFKWRDDPPAILQRIRAGLKRANELNGTELRLDDALLFGYSQGAARAEKLAAHFPKLFPRIVLGGPPLAASPTRLARAKRVAVLGGELETTENMRAGADALQSAGITCRFFTLDCAYHGSYGSHPETQLLEVLDWLRAP